MNKQQSLKKLQLLLVTALLLVAIGISLTKLSDLTQDSVSAEADTVFNISALGISFIPNQGQADSSILYQVNGTTGELYFKSHSLVFALPVPSQAESETRDYSAVELEFIERNEATHIEALEAMRGKVNYLRGNDPSAWLTNIPSYTGIAYRDLYEGVDLSYSGVEGQLKSIFTVAPDANPAQIRWQYRGAERTWVDERGNLMIRLMGGATLREQAPIAWQEINGEKQPVSVAFRVDADGIVDFTFGDYDPSRTLILDPIIEYSTYAGGTGQDDIYGLDADNEGHVFLAGRTASTNFPSTAGVIFPASQGSADVFVMKIDTNASGASSLIWSSYLGGGGQEQATDLAVDEDGNVYITGMTFSDGSIGSAFPTTGNAYSSTWVYNCVFVSKLDPSGASLLYSSFLGRADAYGGIDVDSSGNAYIAGIVENSGFPTTANAYQPTWLESQTEIFVSKIDTNASGVDSLSYSTFILGNSYDGVKGIAVDDNGNAYITGYTRSTNFPITASAYQSSLSPTEDTAQDAFILKLDTNQSGSASLAYSSYFGGAGGENGNHPADDIAIDGFGNAYITGETNATNIPIVRGYQTSYGGGNLDAFIARFDTELSGTASLVYSSYLGGDGSDQGYDLAADTSGNVYIVGLTASSNFPISMDLGETAGSFMTRINTNASGNASLLASTRLGSLAYTPYAGIALDQSSNVYVAGNVSDANLPIVDGFQINHANVSSGDGFLMRISYLSDLQLTRTESSSVLPVGSSRSYTLTVRNLGTDHATNVVLTEDLADIGLVNSAVSTRGTCSIVDMVVSCDIGNLLVNTNATITIDFTASTAGPFTKTASVTGSETDTNLANNTHEGTTLVVNTTDLSVNQSDSPDPVVTGENLSYNVTVSNNGSFDATNVVLIDTLPNGASFVSANPNQGTGCGFASNKVTCNLGTIAISGTATVDIIITRSTAGSINNVVSVSSSEVDSNTSNNSSTITTTVSPPAPDAPTLSNPADGASVANLQPTFTWAVPARAVRYEIQIDLDPAMTAPAIPVTAASYTPNGPLLTTTYYWRVRAFNLAGLASDWSSIREVTIFTPSSAAPLTNYYTTNTPTLSWNTVTWATQYEIQVDNSSTFATPLEFTIIVPASSLSVTTIALSEGSHYWRVRAINATSLGAWSPTALFLIDLP